MMKIHVEVFIASRILGKNRPSFSTHEIIHFIKNEFGDSRPGVMTHVTAVCVANAPFNHPTGYNYLWRIGQGELRPFHPGIDQPVAERKNHKTQPETKDVPMQYRYLLRPQ